jgi:hypothetical protein
MLEQVLKCEKWMANGGLNPVDEDAVAIGDEDIPRIEIETIQCVWNTACGES